MTPSINLSDFHEILNTELRQHAFALCELGVTPVALLTDGYNQAAKATEEDPDAGYGCAGFELVFTGNQPSWGGNPTTASISADALLTVAQRMALIRADGFEAALTVNDEGQFVLVAIG